MNTVLFDNTFIDDIKKLESLLEYFLCYRAEYHKFFIRLKHEWLDMSGSPKIPGLCAEIDSITGKWRPFEKQNSWSWGDGRALSIWSNHLISGVISSEQQTISCGSKKLSLNLRNEYSTYCDEIYSCLKERHELNNGHFPFITDIKSNKPSDDPRNVTMTGAQRGFSDLFCSAGIIHYGILRNNSTIIDSGMEILSSVSHAIQNNLFVIEPGTAAMSLSNVKFQGAYMILLGVCVDVMKSIEHLILNKVNNFDSLNSSLIKTASSMIDIILENHYDNESGILWEFNNLNNKPIRDEEKWITDPGHAAECAGFIAEFVSILKNTANTQLPESTLDKYTKAASRISIYMQENGYSSNGLMYKRINLLCKDKHKGIYDADFGGTSVKTAPWWNVREHSTASLRLYDLTQQPVHLEIYRKAQNASYKYYPNPALAGLMLQTLDAETARPLPLNPATANFDPMHDERARDREIEVLQKLVKSKH